MEAGIYPEYIPNKVILNESETVASLHSSSFIQKRNEYSGMKVFTSIQSQCHSVTHIFFPGHPFL